MTEQGSDKLLLVEDEDNLAAGLKLNIELEGYAFDVVGSAREAARELASHSYDAIILDVMLPDSDGFSLCRRLRDAGNRTPVLMLTACETTQERVKGLEAGADDYMVKPFELDELLARVRSILRRRDWERETHRTDEIDVLRLGDAIVDFQAHEATMAGKPIKLTPLEFDLLRYFATHPNFVLSRQELQEKVWKLDNYPNSRMVDNFIMRLRRQFEPDPTQPRHFLSIRGAGYKFVPDPDRGLVTAGKPGTVEFIDGYDAFAGHEVGTPDPYVNGLDVDIDLTAIAARPHSFHPTAAGYRRFAALVDQQIKAGPGRQIRQNRYR
jgi:DNA-binding response OmpR family regulator